MKAILVRPNKIDIVRELVLNQNSTMLKSTSHTS